MLAWIEVSVNRRSTPIVAKIDGRVAASSTVQFSSDGKTMITTTAATGRGGQAVTTHTVHERQ